MKRIVMAVSLVLFPALVLGKIQGDCEEDGADSRLLKPSAEGPDIAYALMTKGELVNCFMNFGQISDSYFQTEFYNFMWPRSSGAVAAGDDATDDFSFLFARGGNVVDGFTAYRQEDWGPVEGSWGRYHANPQPEELLHLGYPHLAVSDIEETWPEGYDDSSGNFIETPGERHWPGSFRIDINPDSPTYGEEVEGEFAADRVIYCALDDHDNLQGVPMGIRLDVECYEYGRAYAEDFHFYDITITNISDSTLDSCWWGYYFDLDYGEYEDETYYTYSSGLNPGPWDVIYELDPVIDDPGEFETGVFGVAFLKTPDSLGITDAHYYLDTGPTTDDALWPIITSNPDGLPPDLFVGDYFHGDDVHLDDYTLTQSQSDPIGFDWVTIVASGPFDLEPGESLNSVVVVSAGNSVNDFMANIETAKEMFEHYFQGPGVPPAPNLVGSSGYRMITLAWDNISEYVPDPLTGEFDFEGYKLYKSTDYGMTWGTPIADSSGQVVGYEPIAQFDLVDDVEGWDPVNIYNYLGSNTGLQYSYVDTLVLSGVEYTYSITAYDRGDPEAGLPSYESSRNVINVRAQWDPFGPEHVSVTIESHAEGRGELFVDVYDLPEQEEIYQIAFTDSPATAFDVVQDGLVLATFPMNDQTGMTYIDGIQFRLEGDTLFGGIRTITDEYGRDVFGLGNFDTTESWYVDALSWSFGDFDARVSEYEIRFTSDSTKIGTRLAPAVEITETVPFQVWNTTLDSEVTAIVLDDGDLELDEGESIYIVNVPYPNLDIGESYDLDIVNSVAYEVAIQNAPQDTLNLPPSEGQRITITTYRAFTPSDFFEVTVTPLMAVDEYHSLPTRFTLYQNYPNPFNPISTIRFDLRENAYVTLVILNVLGQRLVTLVNENLDAGSHSRTWDGTDYRGEAVASGVYFCRLESEGYVQTRKLVLIR